MEAQQPKSGTALARLAPYCFVELPAPLGKADNAGIDRHKASRLSMLKTGDADAEALMRGESWAAKHRCHPMRSDITPAKQSVEGARGARPA